MMRDDRAVSSVLGAILILGVLFAFTAHARLAYVPVWEEDAEATHQQRVALQMSLLASDLISTDSARATLANAIPLTPTDAVLMGPLRFPGELFIESTEDGLRWNADQFTLFEQNGAPVTAGGSNYEPVGDGGTTLTDVTRLQSLRLRISDMGASDIGSTFQSTFTDDTGAVIGRMLGTLDVADGSTSAVTISVTVEDEVGNVVGLRSDTVSVATGDGLYFLDLLDPELQANALFAAGQAPYDISLSVERSVVAPVGGLGGGALGGAQFDFTAAYEQEQPDGSVATVNPGVPVANFARSVDSTRLGYASNAQYYVAQDLVLDSGAIIASQAEGNAIQSTPGLSIYRVASDLVVTMTVPTTSQSTVSSGPDIALVKAVANSRSSWAGSSSDITLALATPYGDAWAQHWQWALADVGITNGANIQETSNGLTIQLTGTDVDTGSDFDQIIVRFANPTYAMEIQ